MAFSLCFGTFSLILGLKMSGQAPPKCNIVKSFHSTLNVKNWPHLLRNTYSCTERVILKDGPRAAERSTPPCGTISERWSGWRGMASVFPLTSSARRGWQSITTFLESRKDWRTRPWRNSWSFFVASSAGLSNTSITPSTTSSTSHHASASRRMSRFVLRKRYILHPALLVYQGKGCILHTSDRIGLTCMLSRSRLNSRYASSQNANNQWNILLFQNISLSLPL